MSPPQLPSVRAHVRKALGSMSDVPLSIQRKKPSLNVFQGEQEGTHAHLQCGGVHVVFLVSRVFSPVGQWPAVLASCGVTGLSRTGKNVLGWQGAKNIIV